MAIEDHLLSSSSATSRRGLRRLVPNSNPRQSFRLLLDFLTIVLAVVAGVNCLRVGSSYGLAPLIGLILPAARFLASASYRVRVRERLALQNREIRAFSRGEGPTPWRAAITLVMVPFLVFDLSNGRSLGAVDTRPVLPTAIRLVRHGDLDLTEYGRDGRQDILFDKAGRLLPCYQATDRGIYSAFPPGMLPFASLVAGSARLLGVNLDVKLRHWRLEKVSAALVGSLVLGLFFLTALTLGSPASAAVTTLLLATSSAIYTTVGLGMWQHGGVAFWMLMILLMEFRSRGRPASVETILQGISCGLMLTCRPTAAVIVVGFGLWVLARSPRRAVATAMVAIVAYSPCLLLYRSTYGTILGPATIGMNASGSYWNLRIETLLGVLICPGRGLMVYQPWLWLGVVGLLFASKKAATSPGPPGFAYLCAGCVGGPHHADCRLARLVGRVLLGVATADRDHPAPGAFVREADRGIDDVASRADCDRDRRDSGHDDPPALRISGGRSVELRDRSRPGFVVVVEGAVLVRQIGREPGPSNSHPARYEKSPDDGVGNRWKN